MNCDKCTVSYSKQKLCGWRIGLGALAVAPAALCLTPLAWAAASGSVPAGNKPTPDPSPYERKVSLPPLVLLAPDQTKGQSFEPQKYRLSFVCLLGTWNKQSDQVHLYFEKNHEFFVERKIAAVAAFSHDTAENLKLWAEQRKPRYLFGLAPTEFVDQLKNPKVPTCWLLSREGQLLRKFELPSEKDLGSVYDKLKRWTDF
ncbi:MAG: hypothetical protein FJY29_02390 [Betaproteobacteria bacterium]|nr:hypothetical protein [Betaproteobacteria bacterium]